MPDDWGSYDPSDYTWSPHSSAWYNHELLGVDYNGDPIFGWSMETYALMTQSQLGTAISEQWLTITTGKFSDTSAKLKETIRNITLDAFNTTKTELSAWINKYVPKKTGRLRESMLRVLNESSYLEGNVNIKLGTRTGYGAQVNQYETIQVQDPEDPLAIGHFFDEYVAYARERITINIAKAKFQYTGET